MSEDVPPAGGFGVGSRVAGYRLEEQIGRGGMAVVFRALDERLERQVAMKILAPALASDNAFRQRFIGESRAAAAVDDPHIIPVFEAGEVAGVLFIAMRYVRGGDVKSLVESAGPLPRRRACEIVAQVASALDAAHARGLVHRDVKPANMLLDDRSGSGRPDHVYLSDFGLSKASLAPSGLTGTGQFLGTLDYVAPEQIEGKPVDGRADQYALACAAFELLCGEPPYMREEGMAVIYAKLSEPPPPLTAKRRDLPLVVNAVFGRALARLPAERFPTCREFAAALQNALGLRPYDSESVSQVRAPRTPTEFVGPGGPTGMPAGAVPPGPGSGPAAEVTVARDSGGQTPPGQEWPGQTPPGQEWPGQAPPGRQWPGQAAAGQATPGQSAPDQQWSGQASPDQQWPGQAPPGQQPPGQSAGPAPADLTRQAAGQTPPDARYPDRRDTGGLGGRPPPVQTVGLTGPADWAGGSGGHGGAPPRRPRRLLLALAAALVILAGGGGGAYYLLSQSSSSSSPRGGTSSGPNGPGAAVLALPGCSASSGTAPQLTKVGSQRTNIGANPFGLAVPSDGRFVFAATPHAVLVLPNQPGLGVAASPAATYPVSGGGKGETFTSDGKYLLVAAGNGITVINVAEAELGSPTAVRGTLQTQGVPTGMGGAIGVAVSPDNQFAFVTLQFRNEMAVFDLGKALQAGFTSAAFVGTVPLGIDPVGLTRSPDGRWLYAMNSHTSTTSSTGSIAVINLRTAETDPAHSIVRSVDAGCGPARAITSADGSMLWVTAKTSNYLLGFDAGRLRTDPARALVAKVQVGQTPIGLIFAAAGNRLIVANTDQQSNPPAAHNLAVVDTRAALAGKPALLGYIPSGLMPREFALVPGTQKLLVSDNDSFQIQSVNLADLP